MRIDTSNRRLRILAVPLASLVATLILFGCGNAENMEEIQATSDMETVEPAEVSPPTPATVEPEPVPLEQREQSTAEGNYWQDTVWAPGLTGILIEGLNGGEYPPYNARVIEQFQRFLFQEEFYDGPVTGILDKPTMEAMAEFQSANGIVASGVPSPETRNAAQEAVGQTDSGAG